MRDRVKRDRVPYDVWAKAGKLHLTPGNVTDFDQVRADIVALSKKYNIRQVAIDRWNAHQITTQLQGEGVNVLGFGQGYGSMSSPTAALEAAVVGGKLLHGGHPVLRMCAANAVASRDAAGNRKLDKAKATGRIDGMVALAMALGRAVVSVDEADLDAFIASPVVG
jgi:phage terminase large subunit-like protein